MTDTDTSKQPRNPNRPEYYCFKCKISVLSENSELPKCGAEQCHFTKLPQGKNEFKEALSELTTKLNEALKEIEKLKKELSINLKLNSEMKK